MASREAGTGAPESAGTVVLLVDDEPDVASVTAIHLERHVEDVAVVTVTGGEAALERFADDVDCIVSDYEMPDLDGLSLLRRVRERDPDLPFILFTARGSEEIASEAISAGVTDYLQKAVGTDQYAVLANRIENAVARRRSEDAAAETEARYRLLLESSPNAVAIHDGARILFVNDRFRAIVGAESRREPTEIEPLELIHPDDRETVAERMLSVVEGEQFMDWAEWRMTRLDGEVRIIESRAAPVQFGGRRASQVVLRDVTERRKRERTLESLHEATRRFLAADTAEAVGRITAEAMEQIFDEPIVAVWHYDGDDDVLAPLTASQRPLEDLPDDFEGNLPTMARGTVEMSVFRAGEPRVVTGYGSREDASTPALDTVYMFPLDDHGLLAVGWKEPTEVTDTDRDLVGILARTLVVALDRVLDDDG